MILSTRYTQYTEIHTPRDALRYTLRYNILDPQLGLALSRELDEIPPRQCYTAPPSKSAVLQSWGIDLLTIAIQVVRRGTEQGVKRLVEGRGRRMGGGGGGGKLPNRPNIIFRI